MRKPFYPNSMLVLQIVSLMVVSSALSSTGMSSSGTNLCAAELTPAEIRTIQQALDAGQIDDARTALTQTESNDSLELRYLRARLDRSSGTQPAPDLIQLVEKPADVEVRYAVLHPSDRQIVFLCRDGSLRICDLTQKDSEPNVVRDENGSAVYRGQFSADGKRFLSGHENGKVIVRNTADWMAITTVPVGDGWPVRELVVSPDGTSFVAESREGLDLWVLAPEPKKVVQLAKRLNFGEGLAFSPKGDVIATGGMFDITLHDASTGAVLKTMQHASYTMGLEYSPDGQRIASAPRGNVNKFLAVFDVEQGTQLFNAGPFGHYVAGTAFTPDGTRILATGCEKQVRIFDAATGEVRLSLIRAECSTTPGILRDGTLFGWSESPGFLFVDLAKATEKQD
jgi:WD40 repeat protein